MSELAVPTQSADDHHHPKVFDLGRNTILITWDLSQATRFSTPQLIADEEAVWPLASLRLARSNGGMRLFWVMRRSSIEPGKVELLEESTGHNAKINLDPYAPLPPAEADTLLDAIDAAGSMALVSAFLNVWSVMFRLQRNKTFIATLRELLSYIAPNPGQAIAVAQIIDELTILQTSLAQGFGKIDAAYILGDSGLTRITGQPHKTHSQVNRRDTVHLLAKNFLVPPNGALLVLIGPDGLSVRRILRSASRLPAFELWGHKNTQMAPGLREHLLMEVADRSEAGQALALEAQLRSPLKPKRAFTSLSTPSAEIVTALNTPAGTLVTGWYRDPLNMVAGIDAVGPSENSYDLTDSLYKFAVEVAGLTKGSRVPATGFAALAPAVSNRSRILQPRFRLRLKSGACHTLVPPLQPADPVDARAAALRAVPPQYVDQQILRNVLSPVIASLHAQAKQAISDPTVKSIGNPIQRPKVSVIVPLYKTLEFVRFQVSSFAADPWFRSNAELIYVLDSPEQAQEVEHLLGGLNLVYGLPITVVVMDRNSGYARANNTGASFARADTLALVNSDIIPTSHGWLQPLIARLNGRRRVGAVGPKLLFEDGSIQHAGMYFSQDHQGRWLNQHYHKGMPRDYAPACDERLVPAVTGACLVTTKALFNAVGGFTEDYVVGDYEDSDLCLKITMTDRKIAYAPDVELYHLERRSMSLNAEYMRGIAWQYNCAIHTERWHDLMTSLMQNGRQRKARNVSL